MSASINERFAAAVKARREKIEMSQEALAHAAGLSSSYVSRIERGYVCPSIDVLERLGKALRTSGWRLMQEAERN